MALGFVDGLGIAIGKTADRIADRCIGDHTAVFCTLICCSIARLISDNAADVPLDAGLVGCLEGDTCLFCTRGSVHQHGVAATHVTTDLVAFIHGCLNATAYTGACDRMLAIGSKAADGVTLFRVYSCARALIDKADAKLTAVFIMTAYAFASVGLHGLSTCLSTGIRRDCHDAAVWLLAADIGRWRAAALVHFDDEPSNQAFFSFDDASTTAIPEFTTHLRAAVIGIHLKAASQLALVWRCHDHHFADLAANVIATHMTKLACITDAITVAV